MTAARRRSVPRLAIPFLAVAAIEIVTVARTVLEFGTANLKSTQLSVVVPAIPGVALTLIGAALLIRHPDARRTLPRLVTAAGLLVVVALGRLVSGPLFAWLPEVLEGSFPSPEPYPSSLFILGYLVVLPGISALALWWMGRGLRAARRYPDQGSTALIALVVVLAVVVITGSASVGASWSEFQAGQSSVVTVYLLANLLGSVLGGLALGSLAITATRGWAAAETPQLGWALAAFGAWLMFAVSAAVAVVTFGLSGVVAFDYLLVLGGITVANVVGPLLLLAAFAVGLPTTDAIVWYDLADLDAAALAGTADAFDDDVDDGDGGITLIELEDRKLDR